ncbi:MAG: phenylalanine--tRNA ligase beta subunit-related protein [Deferrisomatales bacterium]|nr:phenylalanine--tRNA ligase beta subunit-related protein [Deferrisomatales bacterium]
MTGAAVGFRYAPEVVSRFPTIRGGILLATGVRGGPAPEALAEAFRAEQAAVRERLRDAPLAELPALAAWRQAFAAFGVKPTQYRSAAEALLRRLTKKGDVPGVNLLTDIGNLVSIRYALPVAVLDTAGVTGTITVRFAQGKEPFVELDGEEVRHPEPGEVVFVDDAGRVHARRWCWRQSAESAAGAGTSQVLVTVEGLHSGAEVDVAAALRDLSALLGRFAGGSSRWELLSPGRPAFGLVV